MLLPIRLVRTLVCNCTPPSDTPPYAGPFDFSFFFFYVHFLTNLSIHGLDDTDYPLLSSVHVI